MQREEGEPAAELNLQEMRLMFDMIVSGSGYGSSRNGSLSTGAGRARPL